MMFAITSGVFELETGNQTIRAGVLNKASGFQERRRPRRAGNVVVLTTVLLAVLFGLVAFAIDIGYVVHARTELQRLADSCSLAAVMRLPNLDDARAAANTVAMENQGTVGLDLDPSDIEFGYWDRDTATFTSPPGYGQSVNAVRVTVARTSERGNQLPLFFAPLLGTNDTDVTASATAMYQHGLCGPFVGIERLSVPGSAVTDSFNSEQGRYNPLTARDRGSVCSDGPIGLEGAVVINGDARAGKGYGVTLDGGATVTGSRGSRLKPLNLSPVDASEVAIVNNNSELPLFPQGNSWRSPIDANRNFLLEATQTYDMPPGTYYFNDLVVKGQSVLNIGGPTTIYLTGKLERSGGATVDNFTHKPSNLRIFMIGGTANVTSYDDFYGVIYAPNTDVNVDGGSHYFGAIVGKTLTITGSARGHYDESLRLEEVDLPRRTALVD
jgi:Flp pilus assembly protein TadG